MLSCRAALARAADRDSLSEEDLASALATMVQPAPDRGPQVRALLLVGRVMTASLSVAKLEVQLLAQAATTEHRTQPSSLARGGGRGGTRGGRGGASVRASAAQEALQKRARRAVAACTALREGHSYLDMAAELAEAGKNNKSLVRHDVLRATFSWAKHASYCAAGEVTVF